jgi:hypothetical protein
MTKQEKSPRAGNRRSFLRTVPAAVLCAAVPEPSAAQAQAATSIDPLTAQANALAEVAKLKFGTYLKEGDLNDIKRVIERNLRYGEALSKVPLSNSDEPDFMFIPNAAL